MKKLVMMTLAGGLMMATSAFTSSADAGYGHRHHYKPYYFVYSYTPYYYVPVCKWVFHYGHYKKVCW